MMTPATAQPLPKSGASDLLSRRFVDHDKDADRVRIEFEATRGMLNPADFVQGGILAAMLDDTMGAAIWLKTGGAFYPITIDMTVTFLAAARPGRLTGEGCVVQLGKTIAFLEAQLREEGGALIARATSSVRLVKPILHSGASS
jgi:uncharacterized protein (TIGR00369 family)